MKIDTVTPATDINHSNLASHHLREFWAALGGAPELTDTCSFSGTGELISAFHVSDLAAAAIGAAGTAAAELLQAATGVLPAVQVDRRMASLWFGISLQPLGWKLPPLWDPVAGNYRARDGWIRLHTNAAHHRQAALSVLDCAADAASVAHAVQRWDAAALEDAIVARSGCAAVMYSSEQWAVHPQGQAVAAEPLLHVDIGARVATRAWQPSRDRPLRGIRVLDLTRILAGPVATRFLAGLGAEVLRIDPYGWEEPNVVPDVVLGKRCARLDLKNPVDLDTLKQLMSRADIVVHGYRSDALARLGLDAGQRREINPALIDVSLDAYGWSGVWQCRRGFDSLIQMSTGIAEAGMRAMGRDEPVNLPVQAIDHATGYLMAAAALRGLTLRMTQGVGIGVRASLARTAATLQLRAEPVSELVGFAPDTPDDRNADVEQTSWGPAARLRAPLQIDGAALAWRYPARALGSYEPEWLSSNDGL
ncbi:CoA transferase [Herbaspirillum sp.]|uniref:CoA transferase n=1 Tax=Herbaspirillum sp. TaxID=1890675 RepID=UPI0031DD5C63